MSIDQLTTAVLWSAFAGGCLWCLTLILEAVKTWMEIRGRKTRTEILEEIVGVRRCR